jgi:hypothetical protein
VVQRAELEPDQRYMGAIEVDRRDALRIGDEIIEDVTAARADRQHMVGRPDPQRLEVDCRVFPDLRIDEAAERQRENALKHPFAGEHLVAVNRSREPRLGGALCRGDRIEHVGHPRTETRARGGSRRRPNRFV